MRGNPRTFAAIICATLAAASTAQAEVFIPAEGPTRTDYVAQIEPICARNAEANTRILKGARGRVRRGKLRQASGQFFQASTAFGNTVVKIVAVPRPTSDDVRLKKWFKFLRIVKSNLRKIGKALKEGNKVRAIHETIRAERSGNAANNVGSIFNFRECRLTPSRFS
jgi:hypothetical protein